MKHNECNSLFFPLNYHFSSLCLVLPDDTMCDPQRRGELKTIPGSCLANDCTSTIKESDLLVHANAPCTLVCLPHSSQIFRKLKKVPLAKSFSPISISFNPERASISIQFQPFHFPQRYRLAPTCCSIHNFARGSSRQKHFLNRELKFLNKHNKKVRLSFYSRSNL